MTPTNRTDEVRTIANSICETYYGEPFEPLETAIASAIQSAVEAERERAAKIAESLIDGSGCRVSGGTIATAIRQTPTQEGV